MSRFWEGTIIGNLPSLKNSRPIVPNKRTGKRISIKSQAARDYVVLAQKQILAIGKARPLLQGPVCLFAHIFYRNPLSDLDEGLLMDLMQGFIYTNDNQIAQKRTDKFLDGKHPRVYIRVSELA